MFHYLTFFKLILLPFGRKDLPTSSAIDDVERMKLYRDSCAQGQVSMSRVRTSEAQQ